MSHCIRSFIGLLIVGVALPNLLTSAYMRARSANAAFELESNDAVVFYHDCVEYYTWSKLLPPKLSDRVDRWLLDVESVFVDSTVSAQRLKALFSALPRLAFVVLDGAELSNDLSNDYLRALAICHSLDTVHLNGRFRHQPSSSRFR